MKLGQRTGVERVEHDLPQAGQGHVAPGTSGA